MPPPSPLPGYVFKLMTEDEAPSSPMPETLPSTPLDAKDGFIHLSTSDQVPATADRFFSHLKKLYILKIWLAKLRVPSEDGGRGGLIKWEDTASGSCFAHLYDAGIGKKEIQQVLVFERDEGQRWSDTLSGGISYGRLMA